MKALVYHFSGTGNSIDVAKHLATALEAPRLSIAEQVDRGPIVVDCDALGVVFPVYYAGLPEIVRRFAEAVRGAEDVYVFAVPTYGGGMGDSAAILDMALATHGGGVSAAYGVHMPQNAFRKAWENQRRIVDRFRRRKLPRIVRAVRARRRGMLVGDAITQSLLKPFNGMLQSSSRRFLGEVSGRSPHASLGELIAHSDAGFASTDACTGCGICRDACPVGNIELLDSRPRWRHRCENCLACYNWCPQHAIESSIVQPGYFYTNSDVRVRDIIEQGASAHG